MREPVVQLLFGLEEFDLHTQFARSFLDFGLKEKLIHKGKNTRRSVLANRQRLGFGLRIIGGKAGPRASGARAVTSAGQSSAVTMVHGRAVNSAMLLITASGIPAPASRGTATAPPPVFPSSTGGASRTCLPIVLVRPILSHLERGLLLLIYNS